MNDYLLLENGSRILYEDDGSILLETAALGWVEEPEPSGTWIEEP